MPGPQHADPERSVAKARKPLAWPQETPPPGIGKSIEKMGPPHPTETDESRTLAEKTFWFVGKNGRPELRSQFPTSAANMAWKATFARGAYATPQTLNHAALAV